jgi:hypothetical protein
LMSQDPRLEYALPELSRALTVAGFDLFGFGMALWALEERVRKEIADTLLISLEQEYFIREVEGEELLSHKEYREELFALLYSRAESGMARGPLSGIASIPFYSLTLAQRAVLYLRARSNFTTDQIARILKMAESDMPVLVDDARQKLLGRRPFTLDDENF